MDRYVCDLLITMDGDDCGLIHDGAVDVGGGEITWVGPAAAAPARSVTEHRVSGILMPGMINTHCHTPMVLLRGAGEGLPVDRWLRDVMWPRESRLTRDDVMVGMELGAAELMTNGVTTTVEMYFHSESIAEGAVRAGLRTLVTAPVIEDESLGVFGHWRDQLEQTVDTRARWSDNPLIDVGLGPHAAYSVSRECLSAMAELAAESGMLVHIHLAEQQWEDEAVRSRTGTSAPDYLRSLGLLDGDVIAAHGVWLSDDDIEILADHDVAVAHCPCSNSKHASGVAPVAELLAAGVRVSIATDGPASHHRLDLFEEMRTAIRLARIHHRDAERFTPIEALKMVTVTAADLIGRPDLGRLQVGARADMIAVDPRSPALNPAIPHEDDPVSRIVWSGSPEAVSEVWIEGRQTVSRGEVTSVDVPALIDDVTDRAQRISR